MEGKANEQINQTKQKAVKPKLKYQNQKNSYKTIYTIYLARKCTCHCIQLKTWKKKNQRQETKSSLDSEQQSQRQVEKICTNACGTHHEAQMPLLEEYPPEVDMEIL